MRLYGYSVVLSVVTMMILNVSISYCTSSCNMIVSEVH